MEPTELQKTCWENIGYESVATQKIRTKALEYYLLYKDHLKKTHSFIENEAKIQNLFLISYFVSEKTEVLLDVNGRHITNVVFSINQLVKKNNDYKEFFFHLKQMMKKINLPSEARQAEADINAFIKYFSFVMTFYNKFLSTFDKITICHNILEKDLQQWVGGEKQFKDKIKYMLWLLFINYRKIYFKNNMDTIGNTCLLACLYVFFIGEMYKVQKITSIYATQIAQDYGTFSNQRQEIQQIMLEHFCLKDYKVYEQISKSFGQFLFQLIKKYSELKEPLFSPKLITFNIKKVQESYYKHFQMSSNHLDETLFLKNLVSNQQNVRFTAFGAKRNASKHYQNNNLVQCRRVLNYDTQIKQIESNQVNKKQNSQQGQGSNLNNYLNVFHRIKASQTPTLLIQATPINLFTNSYNWLLNKSLSNTGNYKELNIKGFLQIGYRKDQFQLGNAEILQKKHLVEGLFNQLLNLCQEQNQQNINVCTVLSLEVFYFILNITNRDLTQLVQFLNISWYSVWEGVDRLLNYDKTMPNTVKTHLLLLQTSIVSSFVWKDDDFLVSLSDNDIAETYRGFFFRILHHIAYQINFVGKQLEISDSFMDQSFILSQYFLKEWSLLMKNVHLDTIIVCSMYGVCRAKNSPIKFKKILQAYKQVNNLDQKAYAAFQNFEDERGEITNVILFYNEVFLVHSKGVLMKIKQQKLEGDQIINSRNYVLSPIKAILPSGINRRSNAQGTPTHKQMLFAYNQSPLLNRGKRFQLNEVSEKQNKGEKFNMNCRKNFNQADVLRQRSSNLSELIQKKFGNNKTTTLIQKGYKHS